MTAKQELKRFRNYLRDWKRQMRSDPYIADAVKNIDVRIVKWDRKSRQALVLCRNVTLPQTDYNSASTCYAWVYTGGHFLFMREVWMAVNRMIIDLREKNQ